MKKLCQLLVVVLLLGLALSAQQPSQLTVTNTDITLDPLCPDALANDCISGAGVYDGAVKLVTVPASAFVINGNQAVATIPIPQGQKRYGNIQFTARLEARAFDGSQIDSDVSAPVSVVRRPRPPVLNSN